MLKRYGLSPDGKGCDDGHALAGVKLWGIFKKSFITEFSLKLDPPQSSLRPWHGHRRRSASIGAEPLYTPQDEARVYNSAWGPMGIEPTLTTCKSSG